MRRVLLAVLLALIPALAQAQIGYHPPAGAVAAGPIITTYGTFADSVVTARVKARSNAAGTTPLLVKQFAGQTANLIEVQDSLGVVTTKVGPQGKTLSTNHIAGIGTSPTIAAGAGAGTTPTLALTGTDLAGYITLTAGTSPVGSQAVIATITYATPLSAVPQAIQLTPSNGATAILGTGLTCYVKRSTLTTTTWELTSGTTNLVAGSSYEWFYTVLGN